MGFKKTASVLSVVFVAVLLSNLPSSMAGNGVSTTSSSGTGSTDSITNGYSSVSNINNGFDSSSSSYSRLLADGDFSGNFGSFCGSQSTMAYAEVLYTLSLSANTNQSMTMSVYSQTQYDFSTGWSTVPSLKMTANVTDNGGTWNAWTSTSTNNSASPSSADIDLGAVTPRSNNTIDVLVRLEHQGVWTSSCRAELRVYDFSSDAVVAPNIAYSGSPFTFTKDNTIGTITPSNTGGAATSWSITSGSLPSGLSMSSSTGALTGTPTSTTSAASITIQASNSGGSDSTTISITVEEETPNIAYSGSPFTFTKDNSIGTITPSNTGGAATSWSITGGSLPSGLSMSSSTGALTGTPTVVSSAVSITIQASNSGGSDSTTISITVNDEAPNIAYSGSPFTFTKDNTINTITPSNTGGASSSWSITSGSLPSGLSLSSTTGAISGTPTAVYSTASITIQASNSGGSDSATISITVDDEAPNIGYGGPYTFTKNSAISTITPTNTGGAATSWSITSGSLPSGLSFSSTTGTISGTPTAVYSTASITIQASNSGGSDSATISITVEDEAPNIGYGGPYTFTKNSAISTITPTNTGGSSTSWSITSGSLPSGLSLSSTTGAISGTPTVVYSTASITIEASNAAGSDSATISITVEDEAPNIGYGGPYTFTKNSAISTITPTNSGGAATSWSITSGSLPSGLSFSSTTGAISGTPTAVYSTASLTIEASNSGGSDSTSISITVQDQAPNIGYGGPYTFTKNVAINTITPTNTGGAATSWSIMSGTLPAGLSFSSTTGTITGTPTVVYSTASITIEASNAAGSDSATISITVEDEAPNIGYGGPYTFTKNSAISTITPTNTGGAATSWSITSGSLPSGLSFSSTTGTISGTPTAVYSTSSITIEASNAAGSDSTTISITVEDEAPNIAYGGPYTFTKNVAINTITPTNTGGAATSWSIMSGTLPAGLSFSSTTGTISGTPTAVYSISSITIEASNAAGSDSTTISITVEDEAPNIAYGGPYTFTKNTAINTITPTNTGGAATSWSITSGSLPAGLSLNSANGDIIGTPDAVYSIRSVTVEASNDVGADSFSIMIEVVDVAPNITYAGSPFIFTKNTPITMVTPSNTGGEATIWTIKNGELPDGISLDQYLGVITGTPTSLLKNAQIIVEATNSGGSNSTTVFISVIEDEDQPGTVHIDVDGDGIPDAVDNCPLTPANAQVDDNGCETIEYTTDSDDGGNKLDLFVVGCLGSILGLLGVLVMLAFLRDREQEEEEFGSKEFDKLKDRIQTQEMILAVSSQPLYHKNPDFKAFIDECVLISSNLNNKTDVKTLNLIFNRMKDDVFVPLCAVAYLRGAITCFSRILRRHLMEHGWKAPVKDPKKEFDRAGGTILWNLSNQERKDWVKQMPPILKSCIIFPLIKEQAKKTKMWNELLHPETWKSSDVNDYTSEKLAGELLQSRRFIRMVEILERRTLETNNMIPFNR